MGCLPAAADPLPGGFVLQWGAGNATSKTALRGISYEVTLPVTAPDPVDPSVIPLPATLPLLLGGLALMPGIGRRRPAAPSAD